MRHDEPREGFDIVAEFSVRRLTFLAPDGRALQPLPEWAGDRDTLLRLLRHMEQARRFDAKAVALQRTGKLGTYASSLGQEAVAAGVADAMQSEDVLLPTYRESAAQLARGVTMREVLLYWGGDERGSDFASCRHDFPVCVPVGSQLPHAAGVAYALKHRGLRAAAVAFTGDGGTSKGDFYEALNLAGVWQLPMVVVISNNQWAISVSRAAQTAAETLAQKGIAAGVDCLQVDGNDIVAVREAARQALEVARGHHRTTLIEAVTYRLCDHTTADDASRYRSEDEVAAAREHDPILRLRRYMLAEGLCDEAAMTALEESCDAAVAEGVQAYLDTPPPPAAAMLEHLYAQAPEALLQQQAWLEDAGPEADDG